MKPNTQVGDYSGFYIFDDVAGKGVTVYVLDSGAELDNDVRDMPTLCGFKL